MEKYSWILLISGIFSLFGIIYRANIYKKYHTKDNLVLLIISIIIFLSTVLIYFCIVDWSTEVGKAGFILIVVAYSLLILFGYFYWEIKSIFIKLKNRNK